MPTELLPQYRTLLDVLEHTAPLAGPDERAAYKGGLTDDDLDGMPALTLPVGAPEDRRAAIATARRTCRSFAPDPVSLRPVAALLGYLADLPGADGRVRRLYPAAGSVFAVDVYLHAARERVDGLRGGVYRYDSARHRLVLLADLPLSAENFGGGNRAVLRHAAFDILLVAALDRLAPLYGRHALQFATLEAGYLSQLLMQEAAGCGLGLCPIGAQNFTDVKDTADLGPAQVLIHSLLGGVPAWEV